MNQAVPKLAPKTTLEINNILQEAENAFNYRRRLEIQGIPLRLSKEDVARIMLKEFQYDDIYKSNDGRIHVLFSTPHQATLAFQEFQGKNFNDCPMFTCYSQSTFLMFVGNIPYDYDVQQFRELMEPFGKIERIFIVPCETTGQSKGYGFVEFLEKSSADRAKQEFKLSLNDRNLRIDYANYGIFEYAHVHGTTLFVDKFPSQTADYDLKELFNTIAQTSFCQIATNPINKKQRNFALVDFTDPRDAEAVWLECDGAVINGSAIRISFASPARTGASIIGGQPNRTPQIQNVPVPKSISKLTDASLLMHDEDNTSGGHWNSQQDLNTKHAKDIPPLMASRDGRNIFRPTGPRNQYRPRGNYPRSLMQEQMRPARPPYTPRFQRRPQQAGNRFPSPRNPSGNPNVFRAPNPNNRISNESSSFNQANESRNSSSQGNYGQRNSSYRDFSQPSGPVTRLPLSTNGDTQQNKFNRNNMPDLMNDFPQNSNIPPNSNWSRGPPNSSFEPARMPRSQNSESQNQFTSNQQIPVSPQNLPFSNMPASQSAQPPNWNYQPTQQCRPQNPSSIPFSVGDSLNPNLTQNQMVYSPNFSQRMSQPQTNNVPPTALQTPMPNPNTQIQPPFLGPQSKVPTSAASPMPLQSPQASSFPVNSTASQPLPMLSGQALAAAQQYIRYYQQYYMSTMGNMPGFDMAATLAQITSFAYQYYAQFQGQQNTSVNVPAPMFQGQQNTSVNVPAMPMLPAMQPPPQQFQQQAAFQNNIPPINNASSSGNTASYLPAPGPSLPPYSNNTTNATLSVDSDQVPGSFQRNSTNANVPPQPLPPWLQPDRNKISQPSNQQPGIQPTSTYPLKPNESMTRPDFRNTRVSVVPAMSNYPMNQDYSQHTKTTASFDAESVIPHQQPYVNQTSSSPSQRSKGFSTHPPLHSANRFDYQNQSTQQSSSPPAFPSSSYQRPRSDGYPPERGLDTSRVSRYSSVIDQGGFQQHSSFSTHSSMMSNQPQRAAAKRPYPAPIDHVNKKPYWLS